MEEEGLRGRFSLLQASECKKKCLWHEVQLPVLWIMLPREFGIVTVPTLWFRPICKIEQREPVLWECTCKVIIIAYYPIQSLKYFLCHSINKACIWIEKIEEMDIIIFSSCHFPKQRKWLWSSRTWGIFFISPLNYKLLGDRDQFLPISMFTKFIIGTDTTLNWYPLH